MQLDDASKQLPLPRFPLAHQKNFLAVNTSTLMTHHRTLQRALEAFELFTINLLL